MEYIFCDINYESGKFIKGNILDLDVCAVVSPANSFGFMDGGVDYAYSEFFGWELQSRLMSRIEELPFGELLVGQSLVVETNNSKIPYLISSPTMRVPNRIYDPADIYMACRSAIAEAVRHGMKKIAFPGMGTGCGQLPFDVAEKVMDRGCIDGLSSYPRFNTWREAQEYHFNIWRA